MSSSIPILLSKQWYGIYFVQITLAFFAVLLSALFLLNMIEKKRRNLPPGPIGLPFVGYLPFLGEHPSQTLAKLSEKYGDIISVQLGKKYTVVFNEYEGMKEALSHPAALSRAPHIFDHLPAGIGFEQYNGPEWVEQRRFCLSALKNLGLGREPWEDIVKQGAKNFVGELEKLRGEAIDVSHRLRDSVSRNIGSLLFGRSLREETKDDKVKLLSDFSEVAFKFTSPSLAVTVFPALWKLMGFVGPAGHRRAASILSKASSLMREEIHKHEVMEDDEEDFIKLYLEKRKYLQALGKETKHYFSKESLEGNLNILFLGGSDTIINSLIWLFRLMAFHSDIQGKIHAELDSVLGKDGEVFFGKRKHVPYTFATLLEMERFASINPLTAPRRTTADIILGGFTIPSGTELTGNLWAVHHDPRYWDKPERFQPERFLSSDGPKILKLPSFAPFSLGKRNCPGETVAWMTIFLYFSSIMKRFQIKALPNEKVDFETIDGLVTQMKNPQKLCFMERH